MRTLLSLLAITLTLTSCAPGSIVAGASVVSLESVYLSERGMDVVVAKVKKELEYDKLKESSE